MTIDELAERLYKAGWDSPNDAQWDGLKKFAAEVINPLHENIEKLEVLNDCFLRTAQNQGRLLRQWNNLGNTLKILDVEYQRCMEEIKQLTFCEKGDE
jgi:hypothetical protein